MEESWNVGWEKENKDYRKRDNERRINICYIDLNCWILRICCKGEILI